MVRARNVGVILRTTGPFPPAGCGLAVFGNHSGLTGLTGLAGLIGRAAWAIASWR
jgi:hypothetical protein